MEENNSVNCLVLSEFCTVSDLVRLYSEGFIFECNDGCVSRIAKLEG